MQHFLHMSRPGGPNPGAAGREPAQLIVREAAVYLALVEAEAAGDDHDGHGAAVLAQPHGLLPPARHRPPEERARAGHHRLHQGVHLGQEDGERRQREVIHRHPSGHPLK